MVNSKNKSRQPTDKSVTETSKRVAASKSTRTVSAAAKNYAEDNESSSDADVAVMPSTAGRLFSENDIRAILNDSDDEQMMGAIDVDDPDLKPAAKTVLTNRKNVPTTWNTTVVPKRTTRSTKAPIQPMRNTRTTENTINLEDTQTEEIATQQTINTNNDTEEQNTIIEHENTTEATGTITEHSTGKGERTSTSTRTEYSYVTSKILPM